MHRADASADGSADVSADASPEPVGSVRLAEPPDVRVTLPASGQAKSVVKVGQIFGILVPSEQDFLDEWELEPGCPLGDPLTFISRGDIGRELLWRIEPARVGTHRIKVRLMHRTTRTSFPKATKRVEVVVEVSPP